jgi:hypothetical protein
MIIQFLDLQKQKEYKKSVVMQFLIGYYKDLRSASGVDIPYFIRARDTYNELIHSLSDLNKYYQKIMEKKRCLK